MSRPRARSGASAVAGLVVLLLLATGCMPERASPGPQSRSQDSSPFHEEAPFAEDMRAARWWLTFDDTDLSYAGIREFDDAVRYNHLGRVEAADGGRLELTAGPEGRGKAIRFPPLCTSPPCGMAMVVVEDSHRLNPKEADFAFGASVELAPDETTTGSNIIQKGRYGATGGQWKLQVDTLDGKPSCVVRGAERLLSVRSPVSLADGQWHRVTCSKDGSGVEIDVDGTSRRKAGAVGAVSNDSEIRIGSSGVTDGDDQFHGALDDVFLTIEEMHLR